jgi:hypothetical protein
MVKVLLLLAAVVGVGVWYVLQSPDMPIPQLDQNEWWGPAELKGRVDTTIKPFKVKFEDEVSNTTGN